MRKLGLVAALFACVFSFCGCEEEKENTPATEKEISYVLQNCVSSEWTDFNTDISKIVIFELDKYGNIIAKKSISVLVYGGDVTFYTSNKSVCRLEIYFFTQYDNKYHFCNEDVFLDNSEAMNTFCLFGSEISEEEYLQGVNR